MKSSLILISRFNTNNIGDIVIANTLKRELSKIGSVDCISLFGRPKSHKDIEKVIEYKQDKKKFFWVDKFIRRIEEKIFLNRRLKKNSVVFLGGGNAMVDVRAKTQSANRFIPYIKAAKKRNCYLVALDIGVGPFANDKQKTAAIHVLDQMNFISFRDEGSMKLYEESNGKVPHILSVDPAFFFMEREDDKKVSLVRKIGINLFNCALIEDDKDIVLECLDGYRELGKKLADSLNADIFYYITDEADIPFLEKIENNLQDERLHVEHIEGVYDLLRFYDEMDLVIGTRMHSMILAYSRHVPIVGLNWQNKVHDLFKLLECQDALFSFDELSECADSIVSKVSEIYLNYKLEQEKIFKVYRKIKKRHKNCRCKLTELMEGRQNEN